MHQNKKATFLLNRTSLLAHPSSGTRHRTMKFLLLVAAFLLFSSSSTDAARRKRPPSRGPNCHLSEIDQCMDDIEALGKKPHASEIITNDAGLTTLCNTVNKTIECQRTFMKRCATPLHRDTFDFILEDYTESVKLFCNNPTNRKSKY